MTFLGTAGDVEVMARQQRSCGGIMLTLEQNQVHLDPGPGSLVAARVAGMSPRSTIAVLASNDSLLRSNDVKAAISAMTLDGMDRHGVLLASRSVVESSEKERAYFERCVEGFVSLTPQSKIGINEVTIIPVKTSGKDATGIGLRLSAGSITVGYTGDTSWYETMANDYEGVDVLIINVRHPPGTKEDGFINLDDAERLIGAVKPAAAFLTGFGSKLLEMDLRDLARQIQRKTKVEVTAATDGMHVELDPFAKRLPV